MQSWLTEWILSTISRRLSMCTNRDTLLQLAFLAEILSSDVLSWSLSGSFLEDTGKRLTRHPHRQYNVISTLRLFAAFSALFLCFGIPLKAFLFKTITFFLIRCFTLDQAGFFAYKQADTHCSPVLNATKMLNEEPGLRKLLKSWNGIRMTGNGIWKAF